MPKIDEILKKAVGHSVKERKIKCDCLWCREGGTFSQARQEILEEIEKVTKDDFEDYLAEKHAEQYIGTKDCMIDDFNKWLEDLGVDEIKF